MISHLRRTFGPGSPTSPWIDVAPVRGELFSAERLEQHAESLAVAQVVSSGPPVVVSLRSRLEDNARALLAAYRASARDVESGQAVVPAAEWLLDNYHVVEEQVREIREDLPPRYYRQLPKLRDGPFAGYPRVFGLAWAFVAHTDSHFDADTLRRFIVAYQRVQPLTIGELWAVAITLRLVLVENLRRLADQITAGRADRDDANRLAERLLAPGRAESALREDIAARSPGPLSELFAAQLARLLRDQDPRTMPALGWLEDRLRDQGVSIDEVVQHAQQRQGASNVTVRNVITSMRLISDLDWADWFESVSLVDERLRGASAFAELDFPTRNQYRSAIEQLARGSSSSELDIADAALASAETARTRTSDPVEANRLGDAGYHLISGGRRALEQKVGFRPPPRLRIGRLSSSLGIGGYVGSVLVVTTLMLGLAVALLSVLGAGAGWLALFCLVAFIPLTDVATALVNRVVTWTFGAVTLPGLALREGVPQSLRTLVAVPTLLTSEAQLLEQIELLEVHYLSGAEGDVAFALLSDGVDADEEVLPGEEHLLSVAANAIQTLNRRHGPAPGGNRFLFLHRRRVFNPGEGRWMGWERKRGKLHELNRLLRGASDTTFMPVAGRAPAVPPGVRFVITLDADTRLPRDAATRLIGKMGHPINRPRFSDDEQRVVDGYGILQPRVTPSLPFGDEGSRYQRIFSAPAGIDPYAAAVSDVYQDLFGEGSYTGKGIYDVDAFEDSLKDRVPENTLLSHDLFEGIYARAGLASDIEVVEEFPSRYDVISRREHRWTRGDWQLLPWVFGFPPAKGAVPIIGRGKMLDNLRRSLLAPMTLMALGLCWLLPVPASLAGVLVVLATIAIPAFLPTAFGVLPKRGGVRLRSHIEALGRELGLAAMYTLLSVAFLADHAWRMGDAIVRTLVRLFVTHRHLLEWTTSAQSTRRPTLDLRGFYEEMMAGTALGLTMAAGAVALVPSSWPIVLPFALLWLSAPALALWAGQPPKTAGQAAVSAADEHDLRLIARRTWRFFETFVTPSQNMLPPDNFQEDPEPVIAHRTSPTNIGLYLLSAAAARDFGWTGTMATIDRLEAAFVSLQKLPRLRGHFFNWYDTADLRVLDPPYVSSVDSGNLAGHLIALANACEEWCDAFLSPGARTGMTDAVGLVRESLDALPDARTDDSRELASILDEIDAQLGSIRTTEVLLPGLRRLADKAARTAGGASSGVIFWIEALGRAIREHEADRLELSRGAEAAKERLRSLAKVARDLAMAMDFAFLLDPERQLLSIGYSQADGRLDPSCYDLLASEARLASLFAIAKGDAPTKHWFRLGRTATPIGRGSALISWSGSMFEYLMPSLVMRAPDGSLLGQTNRLVVERQQAYGRSLGVPWGISESAYNARDLELTYQYSNFGVPGLGLKRGLAENVVIAPYATGLAAMVDPQGAARNYARLSAMGAQGRYGFYEALDFTRSRVPDGEAMVIVRNFMAHHQGMTIVAIVNTLLDGQMRARFHREPMIQATELLLQERMPRDVVVSHPRAEEVKASVAEGTVTAATVRRLVPSDGPPVTHVLSNGDYAVMLTAVGSGYSRWRDIAITRWREDPTRDDWGAFVFLRDTQSGAVWSAAPTLSTMADEIGVVFGEDRAEFSQRERGITTAMEVMVSAESDGEVRQVTLSNNSRRRRIIEFTSYAEVVLATPATDNAHPAFAKMFVQTEHLPEFGALVATRRPRSRGEARIWAAHFAIVEGEVVADPQYESDRSRFLGRGCTPWSSATVASGQPLSNTVGTVLDPIFALRQRVAIAPGRTARVAFWTVVAGSRAELVDLVDKHHDRNAFDRAKTLAWTQAQVQLRHLDITAEEAADFQRLAAPILYADSRFRAPSEAIVRGLGPQSGLWPNAISGDLPIVLLRIDDIEDMPQVRQILLAHEYWRMKRLAVDLVIVNERASSYLQDLHVAIETAVRRAQSHPGIGSTPTPGSVHVLRADLMSVESRELLLAAARIVLIARRGSIADQLTRLQQPVTASGPLRYVTPSTPQRGPRRAIGAEELEFFNGIGGFASGGKEYAIILDGGRATPAPWINVIANRGFGFQVAAEGSGYTWSENSRENQLTQWSNDPVSDPSSETIFVRDEMTGEVASPTAHPVRDEGQYVARHGHGYSRFQHEAIGMALELLQYVPLDDPIKISRLTLRNLSGQSRRLSVTVYADWVLGTARGASGPFIATEIDSATGAMFARNKWSVAFPGRVAFADLRGRQTGWTADRTEFFGRTGSLAAPAALAAKAPLSGASGAGFDPCSALQCIVQLAPGESTEVVSFLGQCRSAEEARALIVRYRDTDLEAVLDQVKEHWDTVLGSVQVKTPDRAMDIMLNGWLLYQTLACRVWARSAFYQASGAYGFRDQLQDGMALTFAMPGETRSHLLRAAARQFVEGDVQHWWLPQAGQGVRTQISDDRVWLAFATATYIAVTGDESVLDEAVSFLDGPALRPGEHDAFFQPMTADESALLFEHCARGLDQSLLLTGERGLPLIGTGDWNDGMNRVGEGGRGESVWLGWMLVRTIDLFAPLAEARDPERARRWREHAVSVRQSIEREAWDGEWYRRATFDDGTWLGSSVSDECRIDSIAQSWAVLSGAADPVRAATAMRSLEQHLVSQEDGLALLFWPPFDTTPLDPGYIRGYPPGLRENGGQYSHAAMWSVLAFAKLGDADNATGLFALLNPINHARTPGEVERYKVEPYVVAADVYSVAPHVGRGGWTWYTGSAGWMYRAGIEGILGIRREGDFLLIDPCIPAAWPGFEATINTHATRYSIVVRTSPAGRDGAPDVILDGLSIRHPGGALRVPLDGGTHVLILTV